MSVEPIRKGVTPEMDEEREMLDFCQMHISNFTKQAGAPATRVAIVLAGKGEEGDLHFRTKSWDMKGDRSRIENCSTAATLLLRRAVQDDD